MTHTIHIWYSKACLPVIGKQHNWSWGNYPWLPWPAEKLGHDCYKSPDTLLATVRKGQTVVYPPGHRTDTRPHKTSQLSNTSQIIGVLFQLASKSQTLLTFLGNSCRNGHSQHMSSLSVRGLRQRTNSNSNKKKKHLTRRLTTLRYLQLYV